MAAAVAHRLSETRDDSFHLSAPPYVGRLLFRTPARRLSPQRVIANAWEDVSDRPR